MSEHLAAEQARAREAHERLAEATAAHAAELDQIRQETQARITIAEEDRDRAIARAEADKAEGSPPPSSVRAARRRWRRKQSSRHGPRPRRLSAPPVTPATRPSRRPRKPISAPRPPTRGPRTHAQKPREPAPTPHANSTSCAPTTSGSGGDPRPAQRDRRAPGRGDRDARRRARASPHRCRTRTGRTARRAGIPRPGARGITWGATRPRRARGAGP